MAHIVSISWTAKKERKILGQYEFKSDAPAGVLVVKDVRMLTPAGAKLTFNACLAPDSKNMSILIMTNNVQTLLGMFHWDKVAPFCGIRIETGEYLEFYFDKSTALAK